MSFDKAQIFYDPEGLERITPKGYVIYKMFSVTGENIPELLIEMAELLKKHEEIINVYHGVLSVLEVTEDAEGNEKIVWEFSVVYTEKRW